MDEKNTMDTMKAKKQLEEELRTERPAPWDQIPDIDLYKDQLTEYLKRQHIGFAMNVEDPLTSAMINNYIKVGVLPRANGKRYDRTHIAYLTAVALLKQVLSVQETGELIGLGLETMIVSVGMKIMSVLITVILYGRMIEIYIYVSIAPIPFATLTNREWGSMGTNYIRGVAALAFQAFFIMICVGIYAVLINSIALAGDIHTALWSSAAYTVLLCFSLFKTGSLAKAVFGAH